MTFLARTTLALDECVEHIQASNAQASRVEVFLAQHVLVILCSEMQSEIYAIVARTCEGARVAGFARFVDGASKKLLRSIKTSEIAGFIGMFSNEAKSKFLDAIDEDVVMQYNLAINNRHRIAHQDGVQLTLLELQDLISNSVRILQAIENALDSI